MRILDRHIARSILVPTLLALAVLVVLNSGYLFIDEQSNVGEGSYTMMSAVRYVLLSVPQQLFDLLPAAALIGAMMGLGELARRSEITAMRAAGVRIRRLAMTLVGVGLLVAVATGAIGEYLAPQAALIAQTERAAARTRQQGTMQGSSVWVHEGSRYVRIETSTSQSRVRRLILFDVDGAHTALVSIGRSHDVDVHGESAGWSLRQFSELSYTAAGVTETIDNLRALPLRSADALLDAGVSLPDRSIRDLNRLVRLSGRDREDARPIQFALWLRVAHATSAICCVLLALPFALGNLRSSRIGVRIFLAVGVGIVFVLVQQVVASGVVLTGLSPIVLAWLPTALLAMVTGAMLVRSS